MNRACKYSITMCLFLVVFCATCGSARAIVYYIHSQRTVSVELIGFKGLSEISLFKGTIPAGGKQEIDTEYHGLSILCFAQGQQYPILVGDTPFNLYITEPTIPPSFIGSTKNDFFYRQLSGNEAADRQYHFALLMLQAKQLLDSTSSIRTVKELTAKKQVFHQFVSKHYVSLQHSDMIKRLIGQYFIMHEYADYHVEGAPAIDIKIRYQKMLMEGVRSWLELLTPYIPEHEIVNYCVLIYYNRSMVSLAHLIVENFKDAAFCPGDSRASFHFSDELLLTNGKRENSLGDVKGNKLIAFVSDDCPVSMVETIIKVRQTAAEKGDVVIVAPLQKLSENHLVIERMVSRGKVLFINDGKWLSDAPAGKPLLPLFVPLRNSSP